MSKPSLPCESCSLYHSRMAWIFSCAYPAQRQCWGNTTKWCLKPFFIEKNIRSKNNLFKTNRAATSLTPAQPSPLPHPTTLYSSDHSSKYSNHFCQLEVRGLFSRLSNFRPPSMKQSAQYKWNILERAVKSKSKKILRRLTILLAVFWSC